MEPRLNYPTIAPEPLRLMYSVEKYLASSGLERTLVELVKIRASQVNGCAYCLDMHSTALRKAGVEQRKLDTLAGWRDSRFFDAREGAALAWAEQLTTLPSGAPADATYEALKAHFDEHGIAELTMAVAAINAWNRLGVGMQPVLP